VAYDPALLSFILAGVVGGVAVVMSASTGWETSHELSRATDHWTAPVVTRRYPNDATAQQRVAREAAVLEAHGYRAVQRRLDGPGSTSSGDDPPPGDAAPPAARIAITYSLS
jgi:hypothetical protein